MNNNNAPSCFPLFGCVCVCVCARVRMRVRVHVFIEGEVVNKSRKKPYVTTWTLRTACWGSSHGSTTYITCTNYLIPQCLSYLSVK